MIKLSFATDNSAFDDDNKRPEIARILRALADRVTDENSDDFILRDVNGNVVGICTLEED